MASKKEKDNYDQSYESTQTLRELEDRNRLDFLTPSNRNDLENQQDLIPESYPEKYKPFNTLMISLASIFLFNLLFLSQPITGNVIANLSNNSSRGIGIILFLAGLASLFFYFISTNKKQN